MRALLHVRAVLRCVPVVCDELPEPRKRRRVRVTQARHLFQGSRAAAARTLEERDRSKRDGLFWTVIV